VNELSVVLASESASRIANFWQAVVRANTELSDAQLLDLGGSLIMAFDGTTDAFARIIAAHGAIERVREHIAADQMAEHTVTVERLIEQILGGEEPEDDE
jgi:hypothetical protein